MADREVEEESGVTSVCQSEIREPEEDTGEGEEEVDVPGDLDEALETFLCFGLGKFGSRVPGSSGAKGKGGGFGVSGSGSVSNSPTEGHWDLLS